MLAISVSVRWLIAGITPLNLLPLTVISPLMPFRTEASTVCLSFLVRKSEPASGGKAPAIPVPSGWWQAAQLARNAALPTSRPCLGSRSLATSSAATAPAQSEREPQQGGGFTHGVLLVLMNRGGWFPHARRFPCVGLLHIDVGQLANRSKLTLVNRLRPGRA